MTALIKIATDSQSKIKCQFNKLTPPKTFACSHITKTEVLLKHILGANVDKYLGTPFTEKEYFNHKLIDYFMYAFW